MAQVILPQNGTLLDRLAVAKIPPFTIKSADAVQLDPDSAAHLAAARAWVQTLPQDLHVACVDLLNRLEAWAMYFTKQVADHDIAFGPCGRVLCLFVVQYYAILLDRRAGKTSGKFPNLVELFTSWRGALQQETTMNDLAQKAALLQEQRRAGKPLKPPLGTNLDG
jgi:hypothetical protein